MDGVFKHYVIDLSCNNNFVQVPAVQGDGNNVRGFEVELISNNVQYVVDAKNTIVSIAGTKPDTKQILNQCDIKFEVADYRYKNYLEFLRVLAKERVGVHLHLFNTQFLSEQEQLYLKNIYLINTHNVITHTYFEQNNFYSNYFTENGKTLDYREKIQVLKKTNNQYIKKG